MDNNEILNQFDNLIINLDKWLSALNEQLSYFIEKQGYQNAKEMVSKAEVVLSLQNKLKTIKDEWTSLDLSLSQDHLSSNKNQQNEFNYIERLFTSQPQTGYKKFRFPILIALEKLGGSAKRQIVFAELEKIMVGYLDEDDLKPLPSNEKLMRWEKKAINARNHLLNEGYISVNTKMGIWKITEKGRVLLNELESKQS